MCPDRFATPSKSAILPSWSRSFSRFFAVTRSRLWWLIPPANFPMPRRSPRISSTAGSMEPNSFTSAGTAIANSIGGQSGSTSGEKADSPGMQSSFQIKKARPENATYIFTSTTTPRFTPPSTLERSPQNLNRRWTIAAPCADRNATIVWNDICGLPCIVELLKRKGFAGADEVTAFLQPRLRSLSDPFLLANMKAAVTRIFQAIDRGERIVLFGDYDVDGVTSLALLAEMLRSYGVAAELFLPLRMEEGYGLSSESVERCSEQYRPQLLIAVDCGTSALAEIASLNERGIDVIVLDHHEPKSELPDCVAVVNPKTETASPFSYLCSVGIVFKLCHALLKTRPAPNFDLKANLDLVALGTVADIVPLEKENRSEEH